MRLWSQECKARYLCLTFFLLLHVVLAVSSCSYHGQAIDPDEEFKVSVGRLHCLQCVLDILLRSRPPNFAVGVCSEQFVVTGVLSDGSSVHGSRHLIARTKRADARVVRLAGRFPRIHLRSEVLFVQNKVGCNQNLTLACTRQCPAC